MSNIVCTLVLEIHTIGTHSNLKILNPPPTWFRVWGLGLRVQGFRA